MRAQTTKSCRIQIVSLILAGLISMPAYGEVIPGRWEKVSALEMASPITVELKNGDQVEGDFERLSVSELEIKTHTALARIPKTDVQTITTLPKDGLREGALIGAMIGAGVSVLLSSKRSSDFRPLALGALGAAIGLGIGVAADAAVKSEDTILYKAPRTPSNPKHREGKGETKRAVNRNLRPSAFSPHPIWNSGRRIRSRAGEPIPLEKSHLLVSCRRKSTETTTAIS